MRARAALTCERYGTTHRLTRLRSEGPLALRPTRPKAFEPWVQGDASAGRVSLSAAAAGPLGGDRLELDVRVGAGAVLVLNEISATLALPGTTGAQSEMRFTIRVDDDATLIWMPEPVIAARRCDHRQSITVDLATSARFYLREELIVGRHNEEPGNIEQRLRIVRGGAPVYDQDLRLGSRYAGWDSPAVTEGRRAAGTMIIVDPGSGIGRGRTDLINKEAVSVGLDDDVVQATATAPDNLTLARALDEALALVGAPWSTPSTNPPAAPR
ncbi:MAG: urease accessory protein UreD [Nocardioides sp.]|uniref:urease accessory protein UreD n=1 Tax=Nocardioides sp. TaxID=35761 RepID=UPI003D6C2DF3